MWGVYMGEKKFPGGVKMADITLSDLADSFKRAIIIDFEHKSVWVLNNGQGKIYSEEFYNELVSKIDF